MPKVHLMCGKICSGKSTFAQNLRKETKGVILSVDEITLALFEQGAGDKHDYYVEKTKEYLYQKSLEIVESGIDVILDWGFWTKRERDFAKEFYGSRNIPFEFHYIKIDDEEWYRRLEKRNKDVMENKTNAYFVDEGLANKFQQIFEEPEENELR